MLRKMQIFVRAGAVWCCCLHCAELIVLKNCANLFCVAFLQIRRTRSSLAAMPALRTSRPLSQPARVRWVLTRSLSFCVRSESVCDNS